MQAGFDINLDHCTGCSACRVACRTENNLGERSWRRIRTFNSQRLPGLGVHHLSLACNHCADAPCMRGCPAKAYHRDPVTDAVILNPDHCMGCRYCEWVCPYDAPVFDEARGVMDKCTFCLDRTREGLKPACVEACPVNALDVISGPPMEPAMEPIIAGLPRVGIRPSLTVKPRRRRWAAHETAPTLARTGQRHSPSPPLSFERLRQEWSLLFFTFTAAILVAWQLASLLGGPPVGAVTFAAAGALAMGVSLLHLGNPKNAWRAVFNITHSWVSREIAGFSAFFGLTTGLAFFAVEEHGPQIVAAALGLATVACIDRVYVVPGQRVAAAPHSAMVSLTAIVFAGALLGNTWLIIAVVTTKSVLYVIRVSHQVSSPLLLILVRLGVGAAIPIVALTSDIPQANVVMAVSLFIGELADRSQFYAELDFLGPELQIERDLETGVRP